MTRVGVTGEFGLIARLASHIPPYADDVLEGIGDDVAVVRLGGGRILLLTCDIQVAGVHFLTDRITPYQLGHRVAAINLSDIGAKGGRPRHFLISLGLPADTEAEYLEALYDGLRAECQPFGVDVVGGNVSRLATLAIDAFLVGETEEAFLVTRAGARAGDLVLVTGDLGASRAGLALVLEPALQASVPEAAASAVLAAHLTPHPLVAEGQIIARTGVATAMLDVSDGLAADLGHICDQSRVGVRLHEALIPVSAAAAVVAAARDFTAHADAERGVGRAWPAGNDDPALGWALGGGEDFQLCFTIRPGGLETVRAALRARGCVATVIGEILPEGEGRWLRRRDGSDQPLAAGGWDHFGAG
jgi:thiamine-monophosphate kinase